MRARRLEILDQVVEDNESVVLVGDTVIRLSPLATAILAALTEWTVSREIATSMTELFGPPPDGLDAQTVIDTALRDMADQGLVEHV